MACTPAQDPDSASLQVLPGTHSRYTLIGGAFSVSGNQRFLFTTDYDPTVHPVVEGESIRRGFLIDVQTMEPHAIAWGTAAQQAIASGVLEESGCWQGQQLFITTSPPRGVALNAEQRPLQWQPADAVPCARFQINRPANYAVKRAADGSAAVINSQSGAEIYRAQPAPLGGSAVLIDELQADASGRWLAFVVTRPRGSFTGNSEVYLVDLQSADFDARLLASPGRSLRFVGNSLIFQARLDAKNGTDWVLVRRSLL